jgi:hypothetical protein
MDGELTCDIDAAAVGKTDIDESDVRMNLVGQGHGGGAAARLAYDHNVVGRFKDLPRPDAQHFVIINDEDPKRAVRTAFDRPRRAIKHPLTLSTR